MNSSSLLTGEHDVPSASYTTPSFDGQRLVVLDEERKAHSHSSVMRRLHHTALDLYAAVKIFMLHIVTFETVLVVLTSVLTTTLYYYYGVKENGKLFGSNMSWIIVSFAVVSPMIMQIRQAFTRRDAALDALAETKSLVVNIVTANAVWDFGNGGRKNLPVGHAIKTKALIKNIIDTFAQTMLLPTWNRGRHRLTSHGRKLARAYMDTIEELEARKVTTFLRLHEQVEVMKTAGLPANEASRINQYHWLLQARLERMQNVKFYRTPQATRSFTRLFILILPIFFGPYYVYIAHSSDTMETNFAFSLALAVVTSVTMSGIFNVELAMEDPFMPSGLDGIQVQEEVERIHRMLDIVCPDNDTK